MTNVITGPRSRQITQRGTGAPVTPQADRPNQTALTALVTMLVECRGCSDWASRTLSAQQMLNGWHTDDNFIYTRTELGYQLGFLRVTSPLREVRS